MVEPTPILDSNDKSKWHKIVFTRWGWNIAPVDKLSVFNFAPAYVNAKDIQKVVLDDGDRLELDWYDKGRPLRFKVGDDIEVVKKANNLSLKTALNLSAGHFRWRSVETKKEFSLLKEPNKNSEKINIPAKTKIIDPCDWSWYASGSLDKPEPLGYYVDMNMQQWLAIIDAKSRKVLGWEEYGNSQRASFDEPTEKEVFANESIWSF